MAASPASGVNTITGEGLAEALVACRSKRIFWMNRLVVPTYLAWQLAVACRLVANYKAPLAPLRARRTTRNTLILSSFLALDVTDMGFHEFSACD